MATASAMTTEGKKLSFAKVRPACLSPSGQPRNGANECVQVAASATESVPINAGPRGLLQAKDRRDYRPSGPAVSLMGPISAYNGGAGRVPTGPPRAPTQPVPAKKGNADPVDKVTADLSELKLETKTPNLMVNGIGSASTEKSSKASNSQTPSDEVSQKADSNSELGTKPPSLDDKSITSGTTFALDEKESLRPDDSASVKAAAEDDDAFSVRGSLLANSRMGSEVAARSQRPQIGDMPLRSISQILPESHIQGAVTPQSATSEQPPAADVRIPLAAATAPDGLYRQNPDEKLLEAMQSYKDRLFLLRLEKEVIEFVQDSKLVSLPP